MEEISGPAWINHLEFEKNLHKIEFSIGGIPMVEEIESYIFMAKPYSKKCKSESHLGFCIVFSAGFAFPKDDSVISKNLPLEL